MTYAIFAQMAHIYFFVGTRELALKRSRPELHMQPSQPLWKKARKQIPDSHLPNDSAPCD